MKKFIICLSLLVLGACTYTYTPPQSRRLDIKDYNIENVNTLKTGKACRTRFLGMPVGSKNNVSVIKAMQNGNINTLKMIDIERHSGFLYSRYCTVAYGE
ncbi:TRL domain-containing protein [Pseudomonadota bacterium]